MSSLRLNVTLAETNETRTRPSVAYHEVEIEAPDLDHSDLSRSLLDGLSTYGLVARRAASELTGRPEERFFPIAVEVRGALARSYSVEGIYSGDGGLWGDSVQAVNSSEASFQAAWTMYDNVAGGLETLISMEDSYEDYITKVARGVSLQQIASVMPSAPDRGQILRSLQALHNDAARSGAAWDSITEAKAVIDAEEAARTQIDSIAYLEEETASPTP